MSFYGYIKCLLITLQGYFNNSSVATSDYILLFAYIFVSVFLNDNNMTNTLHFIYLSFK